MNSVRFNSIELFFNYSLSSTRRWSGINLLSRPQPEAVLAPVSYRSSRRRRQRKRLLLKVPISGSERSRSSQSCYDNATHFGIPNGFAGIFTLHENIFAIRTVNVSAGGLCTILEL